MPSEESQTSEATEYESVEEAFRRAAEAAATSFGRPVMGVLYTQAGRRLISTSLPLQMVLSMVRRDSTGKREEPSAHRNRPLEGSHVKQIVEYLRTERQYLMPPIMLNAASRLQTFIIKTTVPTKPCCFVLPDQVYLYVTDGQHRLEALRQALIERPELEYDSIGVTIVEESDLDKVHQDFYDAAQVMPLAKSLLVEYDGREPINWIAREVSANARIFKGRVEKISTVGKNSLMFFTSNQVEQGILQLVVGDWTLYAEAIQKQAEQILTPAKDLWRSRVINFYDEFAQHNMQWREVSERPLESGLTTDVPSMRGKFLHFSGTGLLVLSGVGHAILEKVVNPDGSLSDEQKGLIKQLAALDWSRGSSLWEGYLVGSHGNITNQKNHIALAVATAKQHLDLPITEKEANIFRKSGESNLVQKEVVAIH